MHPLPHVSSRLHASAALLARAMLFVLFVCVYQVRLRAASIDGRPGSCGALGYDELPRYRVMAVAMPGDSSDIMVRWESGRCLLGRVPGNAVMAQYIGGALYLGATSGKRTCGGAVARTQIRRYDSSLRGTVIAEAPMQGFLVAPAHGMLATNACSTVSVVSVDGAQLYSLRHGDIDSRLGSGSQCRIRLVQWSADQKQLWGYVLQGETVLAVFMLDTDTWRHVRYDIAGSHAPPSCAVNPASADLAYAAVADTQSPVRRGEKCLYNLYMLDLENGRRHNLGQLYGAGFWARWVERGVVEFVEEARDGARRRIAVE